MKTKKTTVEAQKPQPVIKRAIKLDFKEFSKAAAKLSANIAFGKWDDLPGDGVDLLASIGLSSGASEAAWLLVYRSLLLAARSLAEENAQLFSAEPDLHGLQVQLGTRLEEVTIEIDSDFFSHPDRSKAIDAAAPAFDAWLKSCGLNDVEANAFVSRLPTYFVSALHDEWARAKNAYTSLKEDLNTPFTQANERLQRWIRYYSWLHKQVESPMFSEAFSLKQLYINPRAYCIQKTSAEKEDEIEVRTHVLSRGERVVIELERDLLTWLQRKDKDDCIRLVSGGPGSGKSSFAKMFASKLAHQGNVSVLFIPLHHFEPMGDLIDAVGRFVQLDGFLQHNPLVHEYREKRLLIIFDGLDELSMQGKIGEKTAQEFVREVQRKVERLNQQSLYLQVVITGRELVVQQNETDFRRSGQILHILPYFIPEDVRDAYVDKRKLLNDDQRETWWQLYGKASGEGYTGLPDELRKGNLEEITSQPLLNYLVALSLRRGKLVFSAETNLNAVYADLLRAIYERGWTSHQHASLQGLEESDFYRLLEEIALASWHGDGRTTTVREIESHCVTSGLKSLLSRFRAGMVGDSKTKVTQLLTAFYFRQNGQDQSGDETFEFTHKSFGEYLTARRIVREARLIQRKLLERKNDPDEGWDERDALHRWTQICGPSPVDEYLLNFVRDEIRLEYLGNKENILLWQETFASLIEFTLAHGLPIERFNPRPAFFEENRLSRNAEEALLVVLNTCANLTREVSDIEWKDVTSFGTWILRLCKQRADYDDVLALQCLSYLNLNNCVLIGHNLHSANFSGSKLNNASLIGSDCRYAIFDDAQLTDVNFAYANIHGASFKNASLRNASLRGARLGTDASRQSFPMEEDDYTNSRRNFDNVDFEGADLRSAKLDLIALRAATLKGARLEGASLRWTNLQGADLREVSLRHAILQSTKLDDARMDGAKIHDAHLIDTPLSPQQMLEIAPLESSKEQVQQPRGRKK
jgi:uncharacterized protein YjbI with pentapeptide repeats